MKISSIKVENFGIHVSREFYLSPGVTLIVGGNGSGKTTLVQAICWAIWGKLLRPLQLKPGASVTLDCSGHPLQRTIGKAGELVDFGSEIRNSNKTRAAENLQAIFGQWLAWRRTLYVTGRTVSAFSLATPKGKFEHLVAVTGADVFDNALERLRVLSSAYSDKVQAVHRDRKERESAYSASSTSLDYFVNQNKLQSGGEDPEKLAQRVEKLEKTVSELETAQAAVSVKIKDLESQIRTRTNTFSLLKAEFMKTSRSVCDACGSTVPCDGDEELSKSLEMLGETLQDLQKQRNSAQEAYVSLARKLSDSAFELTKPRGELQKLLANETVLEHLEKSAISAISNVWKHKKALSTTETELKVVLAEQKVYDTARKVLTNARKRHLLGYVHQIETFANQYLSVIGAKLRVSLVFEDQKLQIAVSGVGGQSYEELSGGEQRRVDLCLVLAMSQAAAGAGTVPASAPLVIDEAFDTLDGDGVEALIYLACEVAKTRQVFLISHAEPPVPVDPHVSRINL